MNTAVSPCSSPLGDFSPEVTSATKWQKFLTDDENQCLHNKSGSHKVLNVNLFDVMFLLVNYGKAFCSSANELQQKPDPFSKEEVPSFGVPRK